MKADGISSPAPLAMTTVAVQRDGAGFSLNLTGGAAYIS